MLRPRYIAFIAAAILLPACWGKETVYLSTGFSLEVDSHTQQDRTFVFQVGAGTLEVSREEVLRIEITPDAPKPLESAVAAVQISDPREILNDAAYRQGLDEDFMRSVAKVESGFRQNAISPK